MPEHETVSIGSTAPTFSLESNNGKTVGLPNYLGKKNLVVFFMREFTCRQCLRHVIELSQMHEVLLKHETEVIVIGGGDILGAKRVANTTQAPFPILADNERKIYKEYGLNKVIWIVQKSAVLLIDKQRIVQYFHRAINPEETLDKNALLDAVSGLAS